MRNHHFYVSGKRPIKQQLGNGGGQPYIPTIPQCVDHFDDLVQARSNSSALAMDLLHSWTNLPIYVLT